MSFENDGNLEDILTTPPQPEAEEGQKEAVLEGQPESTPQSQASETQDQPAVSSLPAEFISRAQAAGLQLDGVNDPAKAAELLLDRYLQERAYADYGRTSLAAGTNNVRNPKADAGNASTEEDGGKGEGKQGFDEEGHFGNLWKVPGLDEACKYAIQNGIVVMGEDGLFQAKPGYETMALPLLQNINQAHISQKELVGKLFEGNFYQNVDKGMWPAYEARINKLLDERLNSQFQSFEQKNTEKSFIDGFVSQNQSWLYDSTGQNLSPEGLKFQQAVQELRENGITNPQTLANYAIKIAGINTSPTNAAATGQPGQPATQPSAAQNNDKPRDEHGRYLPPGKAAPVTKTKQETFIDRARKHASNSDSRSGGLNSGSDYQVANDADLDNMFTEAWKHAAVV